jgi:hypothetical protein|tara:strand:+ start:531 stop:854 length:324 start_codon:yes stop_codon:yes gene_type:complete
MAEDTNTSDGAGQETQQQLPPLFNATLAQLSADRENALAVLEMLFNRSVGIGDHTNIVEEITKTAKKLADATGTIQVLSQTFGQQGQQGSTEGGPQVVGDPNISTQG